MIYWTNGNGEVMVKHKYYKRFAFPFNKHEILTDKTVNIEWFKKYAEIINEVYCDPNDLGIDVNDMQEYHIQDEVYSYNKQEILDYFKSLKGIGIKTSLVFNDIFSDYSHDVIDNFLREMREYIDILVVPNKEWLIYKKYGYFIKNSVIEIATYEEIERGDFDDYDLIYVHDEIIHNHDLYKELKERRNLTLGCLVNNQNCWTTCPVKKKHYKYISRKGDHIKFVCNFTKNMDLQRLQETVIPKLISEYDYYLDVIDLYKLQGRRGKQIFRECIEIIELCYNDTDYHSLFLNKIDTIKWKNKIRNCGGDCPNCSYCEDLLNKYKIQITNINDKSV